MKTSVVVATYNSEKYIEKQLMSILNQSKKVDEVLIQDDCSNDGTFGICKSFVEKNNLDWKVIQNENNKGFKNNFISALKKTTGDIIFLCDQDDIWKKSKVAVMKEYMQDERIKSLASTVDLIDENDIVYLKHLKYPHVKKGGLKKISPKSYFRYFDYLGMTMAIKKELVSFLEENNDDISHDVLINFFAVKEDGFFFLDQSLTLRRSSKENLSYLNSKKEIEEFNDNKRARAIAHRNKYLKVLKERYDTDFDIEKIIKINETRVEYLVDKKITSYIKGMPSVVKIFGLIVYIKDGINILKRQ